MWTGTTWEGVEWDFLVGLTLRPLPHKKERQGLAGQKEYVPLLESGFPTETSDLVCRHVREGVKGKI